MNEEDLEYLNISFSVGKILELAEQAKILIAENKKTLSVAAFKNEKVVVNGPLYKSEGVNVWKNVKTKANPEVNENSL